MSELSKDKKVKNGLLNLITEKENAESKERLYDEYKQARDKAWEKVVSTKEHLVEFMGENDVLYVDIGNCIYRVEKVNKIDVRYEEIKIIK